MDSNFAHFITITVSHPKRIRRGSRIYLIASVYLPERPRSAPEVHKPGYPRPHAAACASRPVAEPGRFSLYAVCAVSGAGLGQCCGHAGSQTEQFRTEQESRFSETGCSFKPWMYSSSRGVRSEESHVFGEGILNGLGHEEVEERVLQYFIVDNLPCTLVLCIGLVAMGLVAVTGRKYSLEG